MKIFGTAKGGALSKKDFGVAFGGNGVTPSNQISQENQNDSMGLLKDGKAAFGYLFEAGHDLLGEELSSVSFYLSASIYGVITSGTISVYCGQNGSSTSGNVLIGSIDASTISTSEFEWKEFTGIGTKTVLENDKVWIQYSVEGDQRASVGKYQNASVPPNFWGNGGELPTGNDAGTTDAGDTISCWSYDESAVPIGVAPATETSTPAHITAIKISYE